MWRPSRKLVTALTLHIVGEPNYAQFSNRVHAGGVDVQTEANHADGANDLLVGCGGLERRDEPGRAISSANLIARAKTRGCGTSNGEAACEEGKDQGTIQPDSPTMTEENRRRRLGSGLRQQPRQPAQGDVEICEDVVRA